jgi:hypothetical protein
MTSDGLSWKLKSAERELVLAHASEWELLSLVSGTLDAVRQARLEAHFNVCTICSQRWQVRRAEHDTVVDGLERAKTQAWQSLAPALRRLAAPFMPVLSALGEVERVFGPAPATGELAGAAMGHGGIAPTHWALEDGLVTINVSVDRATGADAALDVRVWLGPSLTIDPTRARLEILDDLGEPCLSGSLAKFESMPARLSFGRWLIRVRAALEDGTRIWEVPIEVMPEPAEA